MSTYICIDLGATSGRITEVNFNKGKISLKTSGRFLTEGTQIPYDKGSKLIWDIPNFWKQIKEILVNIKEADSIAVDSWGVDFSLLDKEGRLMTLPTHYRDLEHLNMAEDVIKKLGAYRIHKETGIQIMPINTLYQIYALWKNSPHLIENSSSLLMISDLFTYFLSGEKISEYTIATSTQMYNTAKDQWAKTMLENLGLPTHYLLPVTKPGKVIGKIHPFLNFLKNTEVVATASHDTASAIACIPMEEDSIYISSGTWSLVGTQIDKPLINEKTLEYEFTNEGGLNKITFLQNITGMWIFEECRRQWNQTVEKFMKVENIKLSSVINVDDKIFQTPGDMPKKIADYCIETGQKIPQDTQQTVRTIFESLALKYRWVIENIEKLTNKKYSKIHIVGGGAKNEILNQLTANVTGKIVIAGPWEATTIGSAIIQMLALGHINTIDEGREIVRNSFEFKTYNPCKDLSLEDKYSFLSKLLNEKRREK